MPPSALPDRPVPRLLRQARRQLMNSGSLPPDMIQSELSRSWLRSWNAGLQPCGRTPGVPHASAAQLARALEIQRELVAHARPVMEFLFDQTRDSDSMVVLAGTDGMLLHASGDPQFVDRAERVALRPGATWHEQYRGTNAIGTALTDDRALVVHADEHFLERNGFLTCAAAPIHAPDGHLLGALDVSGDYRGYHRHTLGLVRSAARMIEHRLFETRHDLRQWAGLRLRLHAQPEGLGTMTEGLLAVRGDGVLVGASVSALDLLGLVWQDLGQVRLDAVLVEPLDQLFDWCQRSVHIPRVVHTTSGESVWLRAETGRSLQYTRGAQSQLPEAGQRKDALAALDTGDAVMQAAIARARKVMDKPIPLLLQGESGVGKEMFARAVHDSGTRCTKAFVAVNCSALPENLIEAELFGYQGGAFTGARREGTPGRVREAHGGTLFLDEIGDMPLSLQARLLRVLQEREVVPLGGGKPVPVDFSLVCATHRQLPLEMQAGRFREDLYYRINGLTLQLPALRERSDFDHLLETQLSRLVPDRPIAVAAGLRDNLRRYPWPGNVRQLANALRTACALLEEHESIIDWHHLSDDLALALGLGVAAPDQAGAAGSEAVDVRLAKLQSISRQAIAQTVAACAGNLSEAARVLGVSRNTVYRRLREVPGGD
ncbi:sigma-54-dependent Fis family transcriptional regulator [Simplicispira sp. 110]|uniref:sigma-54-dependent Fis family transcriptional regulator n=1 Tax=Simplicispira sp. 110 TaxID=2135640 RepID=UPI000D5CFDBC|nr:MULTISPECIES: sigma-54-dependent Fis family transcriptional regulator [unclassified Simplicispira]MBH1978508.1 sigma-54-dependent Fis family transcriptional regulator [Comamonadaceae bacterium]PVY55942.1 transcriptional regulator of acetoin/glycerol metabolism [Simplicispira sp. 125]REG16885.1 transcriptional regulator of acetoin/glycerol metabolism [Simplicispira sp. 110]